MSTQFRIVERLQKNPQRRNDWDLAWPSALRCCGCCGKYGRECRKYSAPSWDRPSEYHIRMGNWKLTGEKPFRRIAIL